MQKSQPAALPALNRMQLLAPLRRIAALILPGWMKLSLQNQPVAAMQQRLLSRLVLQYWLAIAGSSPVAKPLLLQVQAGYSPGYLRRDRQSMTPSPLPLKHQ
ncbi:hypothetical protein NIM72_21155 [Pantoea sp. B550]|uniref:hypothetical protein n=1 Tax=Pantoea TaxID=53335 RepID=UPI001CA43C83|nr:MULTISPECIES: hypothetical protein [Pantoea]MCP1208010.1 hypothetical protein [Pantoea sp. B550]QZX94064.1 hypothetical protein K6R05_09620 [Pantoea alfalfae]WIL40359.1 hypothetical protein QPJ96_09885 [Pantoea agglomerans]